MFDLHTHYASAYPAIVNRSYGRAFPDSALYSAGLHPWYVSNDTMNEAMEWMEAQVQFPQCKAIGETGLDKRCDTDWILQEKAFVFCVEMALVHQKPLILHGVRAYDEILAVKKKWGKKGAQVPWIFHGFNKKPAVAEMLLRAGAHLSFGAAILQKDSPAAQSLKICPTGRYYFETDDQPDIDLADIYQAARAILGAGFEEPEYSIVG